MDNYKSLKCSVEDNGIGRSASALSRSEEDGERIQYGSHLAEKLVSVTAGRKGKTSFRVVDLVNASGEAGGTRTEFSFLKISN